MTVAVISNARIQTPGEEIANATIHGVGVALSITGLVVLILLAQTAEAPWSITAVSIYGTSLILAYLSSTLYHSISHSTAKRVLRVFDHCMIFLLIAGTYTPVALLGMAGGPRWILLAVIWFLALAGIVTRMIGDRRLSYVRKALYIGMGWLVVAWADPLIAGIGWGGSALILAGGVAYTAGVGFYAWKSLRFSHAIWHVFVLAGSLAHFLAVALYMLVA